MPKFDRSVLAKFLPQRYIEAFEKLNASVDTDLPALIEQVNGVATQAGVMAQQALLRLDADEARIAATELTPARAPVAEPDDLSRAAAVAQPFDDLAPTAMQAAPYENLSPSSTSMGSTDPIAPGNFNI